MSKLHQTERPEIRTRAINSYFQIKQGGPISSSGIFHSLLDESVREEAPLKFLINVQIFISFFGKKKREKIVVLVKISLSFFGDHYQQISSSFS